MRLLDGSDMEGNQVTFTSYARMGNSFLRKLVEQVSCIYTGSEIPFVSAIRL
jgi:hypothetical protein